MENEARRARDAWIACRCQLGEPGAFDTLVSELERPLFYYVLKLLGNEDAALDVLQEVWVKVFRGIHALRVPEALRPWLYRVARGTALNRVRDDDARSQAEEPMTDAGDMAFEAAGDRAGIGAEQIFEVHDALDRLERRHREVLVLLFLEGLSVDDIALVVGIPAGTVKSRVYHAKKALRALLGLRP
ncbi:MAG: RNA polymerase sigma factor [Bacteroidales bacterium]